MKKIKKIIGALTLSLSLLSTVVMAEVPKNSVILGEKGFSLEYANDVKNTNEMVDAVKESDGKIFIKLENEVWFNNQGNIVEKDVIPEVEYKDEEGNIKYYKEKDGDKYIPGEEKKEEGKEKEEKEKEEKKEEGNSNGGGSSSGGDSSNGGAVVPGEIKAPRVKSAYLTISDGSTLNISISEISTGTLIGTVNVANIGENNIVGTSMNLDQENCTLSIMGQNKTFDGSVIRISADDEWVKDNDNGEPGVGLKKLKEIAKHSEDGKTVNQAMHIENKDKKSRKLILKLIVE